MHARLQNRASNREWANVASYKHHHRRNVGALLNILELLFLLLLGISPHDCLDEAQAKMLLHYFGPEQSTRQMQHFRYNTVIDDLGNMLMNYCLVKPRLCLENPVV